MSEEQPASDNSKVLPDNKGRAVLKNYCKDAQAKQLERYRRRRKATPPAPLYTIKVKHGVASAELNKEPQNMAALMEACGTADILFAQSLASDLNDAICYTSTESEQQSTLNAGLTALAGLTPADEMEAMLAAQMIATHKAGMNMLGRAMRVKDLSVAQWQSGFAIKLLRTYAMQVEALQRYRGKGQQKMTVEHVHVHAGGQAIVGNVTGGGGVKQKTEEQPHAKQIDHRHPVYAPMPAMPRANEEREPVPIPRDAKR